MARVGAFVVDGFVMSVMLLVVVPATRLAGGDWSLTLAVAGIAAAGYFVGMPATRRQATVGMSAVDIRIVTSTGEGIGLLRSAWRFVASVSLPAAALLALHLAGVDDFHPARPVCVIAAALAGFLMAKADAKRRALHDIVAGTRVVRDKAGREGRRTGFWRGWLIAFAIALVGDAVLANVLVHSDRVARNHGYEAMIRIAPIQEEIAADLLRSKAPTPRTMAPTTPDGPVTEVLPDGRIVLRFPKHFEHGTVTYTPTIRDGKAKWTCVAEGSRLGWARARCLVLNSK